MNNGTKRRCDEYDKPDIETHVTRSVPGRAEWRQQVSNGQWNDEQAYGERALREHQRRADLDSRLGDALRASGINAADALAVQALYATAGQTGSHRIVSALRAVEAWLSEGGAL
jgi:hypothetical protein